MKLNSLLEHVAVIRVTGPADREVTAIAYDSRRVKPGAVFVAVQGEHTDGAAFIPQALAAGASAIVAERDVETGGATKILVANARHALADLAAAYYIFPGKRLRVAGVTGTNGKTTVAFLIKHICDEAILRCGLIGTVRYQIAEEILPAPRTTPESLDLHELLWKMESAGCKAVAMEVSSHALTQSRVRGVEFDAAIFTNLTQDHLDYHRTMEAYFEAKAAMFTGLPAQRKKARAIINVDDRYGRLLAQRLRDVTPVTTYGQGTQADFRASNVRIDFQGASYQLDAGGKSYLVRLPLIGGFNVYNSLAALAACNALGVGARAGVLALAHAPAVPGRLQSVPGQRAFKVFVDYAHTDDALLNVMKTCRELKPGRLIVVFGCGGNRDRTKRPRMGAVVDQHADFAFVTSDNPRREKPEEIINDIIAGMPSRRYEVIIDRKRAIQAAIEMAEARDIVLVAGKGHETKQEFADHTIPFDDVAIAASAMGDKRTP